MIISASRRTDIPAFYFEWFCKRIAEGYVLVRNPMNPKQVSKINLSKDVVDGIVFWSKNPKPLLENMDVLQGYAYYIQFTLNPYAADIEQNLPSKEERITTFIKLSEKIGKDRVVWRYDPVFLNQRYSLEWHVQEFSSIAKQLSGYTTKCVFSFIDRYRSIQKAMKESNMRELTLGEKIQIAEEFSKIARKHHLKLETCAEELPLDAYGISHGRCIDERILSNVLNCPLIVDKDKNQRLACGCVASIDIGQYNTCNNGCRYCYANHSEKQRKVLCKSYDVNAPMLCGALTEQDVVKERKVKSDKDMQMKLFRN